jgi:hypothetical protein
MDVLTFLHNFIWSHVSDLMRYCDGSDKGTASVHQVLCKSQKKMWRGPWQWLDKHSGKEAWPEKSRQLGSKVRSMFIIFFDIKWIVHKEFVLLDQTVNSIYCCDILWWLCEILLRLRPELRWQKDWLLHHNNAPSYIPFSPGFFCYQKQHDCRPPLSMLAWLGSLRLFSVSLIERSPFWHNWGDRGRIAGDAEDPHRTQVLGIVHVRERGLLGGWWWPVGPKLVFDHMRAKIVEIMDTHGKFKSFVIWYM